MPDRPSAFSTGASPAGVPAAVTALPAERVRAAQPGGHADPGQRQLDAVVLGARGQDALDGAVGRVAGLQGPGAGRLQPGVAVPLAQPQHALRLPQPEQRVHRQQLADQRGAGRADHARLGLAPDRGAHEEPGLVLGQVGPVGAPPARGEHVGLDQLPVQVELHHGGGGARVQPLADQPVRHRVQRPAHHHVRVRGDLGRLQVAGSNGASGSGSSAPRLLGGEHLRDGAALQRPRPPLPGHLHAPRLRVGGHRRQARPAAPGEEAGPDVPLVRLDDSLVPRMVGAAPGPPGTRNGGPARHTPG